MTRPGDDVVDLIQRLLERHLPGHSADTVTFLGAGLDNTAYALDGELVVRLSREADPAERSRWVLREARLLSTVATRSPLPVPEPVMTAAEDGCLVYRKLPGRPLLDLPTPRRTTFAAAVGAALGGLLAALHAIPHGHVAELVDVDDTPPVEWLEEARGPSANVDTAIPEPHRPSVRAFLDAQPPGPAERLDEHPESWNP